MNKQTKEMVELTIITVVTVATVLFCTALPVAVAAKSMHFL